MQIQQQSMQQQQQLTMSGHMYDAAGNVMYPQPVQPGALSNTSLGAAMGMPLDGTGQRPSTLAGTGYHPQGAGGGSNAPAPPLAPFAAANTSAPGARLPEPDEPEQQQQQQQQQVTFDVTYGNVGGGE